ncbi:hypothetical protein ACFXJ8_33710 [Nonomuraea sp. NPDC059194]|uniref:hypothetical protein n=1 Tax=Nonomuraea sp. NPDC059194 TaxID=3346764 RepID=UPI00367F5DCD
MSLTVLAEILLGILLVLSALVSAAVLWTEPPRGAGRHRTGFCALFRHDRYQRPGSR